MEKKSSRRRIDIEKIRVRTIKMFGKNSEDF
jgi:hypothetical protein